MIFTAGVTAGIDGALRLAAELRGKAAAEAIQLAIAYASEPPFDSGRPDTAPPAVLKAAGRSVAALTAAGRRQPGGSLSALASQSSTMRRDLRRDFILDASR